MEPLPLPTSLAEVEALIRELYRPFQPDVARIQDVLHRLQKSPEGWQLAQTLITHREDEIRFFAALTLMIKLNRDSASLSEDDAKGLLESIINWTIQSMQDGAGPIVTRKLCSALVTYFVHFSHLWPNCVHHFIYCLDLGRGTRADAVDDALASNILVDKLDRPKLRVAVWFAITLVEEVGKTDMNSAAYSELHTRLVKNGADVVSLLARGLSPPSDNHPELKIQQDALSCYLAWILYGQRANSNIDLLVTPLRQLVDLAMQCFADQQLLHATAELFSDVLSNYSGFFTPEHYSSLATLFDSQWAAQHYEQLVHGNHTEDGIAFGLFLLAYGDATVHDLVKATDDRSRRFLARLSGLLAADGYLVGEDMIFVPALEFWLTYIETTIDCTYSDEEADVAIWKPYAEEHLKAVIMNCWRKVQWPPAEVFAEWDQNERANFGDARKDVADMLQSVFTLEGLNLISYFTELFLQSLATQSWSELEATIFCLSSLSDCVSEEDDRYDEDLAKVFASGLFDLLSEAQGPIPLRLRQTALSLIERYNEYFERHSEFLPNALNLLFAAVGDPVLGGPAARSISTLCSSCRTILTGEAGAFISHYQTIRNRQVLDSLAEEKIILAIASVIQSIPSEDLRLQTFEQLYDILKKDLQLAVQLKSQPEILDLSHPMFLRGYEVTDPQKVPGPQEIALQIALRSMRCLASMAKGMQDVKEYPIDLESDGPQARPVNQKLSGLQTDIMSALFNIQRTFSACSEAVETICHIFKAGFSETEPGPFVFPPSVITDYFVQQPFGTPRLGALLSTACSFVGSLYRGPRAYVPSQLARLLPWVVGLLQTLQVPENDTEISQNGICFVDKVMAKYPDVLFQLSSPQLEFFFLYTIKVLQGKEPLPKSASADFWSNFISLKPEDPSLAATVSSAMTHLGPLIAQTLVSNIGGNAARSELDKLSEPLKKLVTQQVQAQQWLEAALSDESGGVFPAGERVSLSERWAFVKKVIGLRGARQTNQVVRDFWLLCRGQNFAYVS
ncbi:putative importin [Podospora fimiseda]|uniref:Importin n=1 Tax=Podospora fimiseda TaxID=252190 RepID=A0AAN7H588_9PEZI|nr:putative importin [Podospora fimiseda]